MPIRINLLAEAQAAEELRRKDPVKRALFVSGLLVFLIGLWASTLQFKIMAAKGDLGTLETKWRSIESGYKAAVDSQRAAIEAEQKLAALQTMTTNRFLWGSALNGMQQSLNGVDDVQVVRLKTEQVYFLNEETKPRTNGVQVVPGRPATATERITLTIDAMDSSPNTGSGVNRFKEAITKVPYFKDNLTKTNGVLLTSRSAPQGGRDAASPVVMFTLQCYYPERTR